MDAAAKQHEHEVAAATPRHEQIPKDALDLVRYLGLGFVATVGPDGEPNVSPKGSFKVLDEHTLVFGEIASPGTLRNLGHSPRVEINVVDVFHQRGFRFRGTAHVENDEELIAYLNEGLGAHYPINTAVVISVEETRPLVSPIHWVRKELGEEGVVRIMEHKLGYYRRDGEASPERSTRS